MSFEARRAPLRVSVTTNGKVEPIDEAEVRARLGGRVLEIPDPGTEVKAGEPLLRIDGSSVAEQLAAAESESLAARESLEAARRALAVARRSFETDEGLFAEGAITRQRFEESRGRLPQREGARRIALPGGAPAPRLAGAADRRAPGAGGRRADPRADRRHRLPH